MNLLSNRSRTWRFASKNGAIALSISLMASALCAGFLFTSGRASAACAVPSTSYGTVTSTVKAPSEGTYRIWTRMMAPDANNNSYLLEVDGGACYTVGDTGLTSNQWGWVDYQAGNTSSKINVKLAAGNHTFKLIGREPSVKIDRVMAVLDGTCPTGPTGKGDNCMVETDTVAPVVNITVPAEGTTQVTGTVNVTAAATDAKGVTKVDFYVDNFLKSTDTTAPYNYSWNTAVHANGAHSLTVKAYDAAGNIGIDSSTVTTRNGDLQAPSAPTNLKVTADAANKVTLSWTASSDNTGVAGYIVRRDGVVIASGVNGVSYTDATVAPSRTYNYTVLAYDAAGNNSAAATAVSVKTPAAPDAQAPSTPTNVAATAKSNSQINLSWKESTDNVAVVGYDVYRGTLSSDLKYYGSYGSNPVNGLLTFGDTGLKASTQYFYYVIAKDANGNASVKSATVSATTAPNPTVPTKPTEPTKPTTPTTPTKPEPIKTGVIRGKVTGGKAKKSVSGVRITATANGKRYVTTSNRNGIYRFSNLPAGTYQLHYKVAGYERADETLRLKEGKNLVWNMWLVKKGEKSGWRWWWN